MSDKPVAVVGAGIVGVCCASWLQRSGYSVTLFDGNEPGSITSSGNACTIADYACVPINSPSILKQLPSLCFSPDSPLKIDLLYAISHPKWFIEFLNHCRPSKVNDIISSLAGLLRHINDGLDPLVETANAKDLFVQNGAIYVYATQAAFEAAAPAIQARREHGISVEILENSGIKELEPGLKADFFRGLYFAGTRHTLNPQTLVTRLFDQFIDDGGNYHPAHVVRSGDHGESVTLSDGNTIETAKVVISAGAFSKRIDNAGTSHLPLETERGYHVQYAECENVLSRPVGWAEGGFYAVPMNQGLRLAGTVEIASLDKPANEKVFKYLRRRAKQMFQIEQEPNQTWLGYRPTFPDALPVIGHRQQSPNLIYAFGHQHIGLTLGGITGKLVAEIADGKPTCIDTAPFSPSRFD